MDLFNFPHLPTDRATIHVALFRNVKNAAALRKRIIAASTMEGEDGERERLEVNFAFVDARLITSRLHLQTAIYQSILAESQNALRTKTVHSEVLWNLNPTNNITEAIRRYGVSDNTNSLLVVRIDAGTTPAGEMELSMKNVVDGNLVPFSQLRDVTDWSTIKKYHKLDNELAMKNSRDITREHAAIDNIVTSLLSYGNALTPTFPSVVRKK